MQKNTSLPKKLNKEIGIIGLGKMGRGLALNLHEKGWRVVAYNRTVEKTVELAKDGIIPTHSFQEFVTTLTSNPRVILIMMTAGDTIDQVIFSELVPRLSPGDIIIDAGNSFYKDAIRRAEQLKKHGIYFFDIGVSGGPAGARNGACLMIGGPKELFEYLEPMFKDLSLPQGYAHFAGVGAGHFVKMVHNGIEYGMMQAIGEGFEIMKKSDFNLDLIEVSRIYNTGSVIESRLIGWMKKAFEEYGSDLEAISGSINSTGEGEWTVKTAEEMGIPVPIIKGSFEFRKQSTENPSYTGKAVSALRGQFGGHAVKK